MSKDATHLTSIPLINKSAENINSLSSPLRDVYSKFEEQLAKSLRPTSEYGISDDTNEQERVISLIKANDIETLMALNPPIENWIFKDRNNLVHVASEYSNTEAMISFLNEKKFKTLFNQKTSFGETILHKSIKANNVNAIEEILKYIEDNPIVFSSKQTLVHERNDLDESPLYLAVKVGSCDAIDLLITAGANFLLGSVNNNTPLHCAAQSNSIEVVKTLYNSILKVDEGELKWKRAILLKNSANFIPIMLTSSNEILEILAEHHPMNEIVSNHDGTLLHWACEVHQIDLVNIIIQYVKELDIVNHRKLTPLRIACKRGGTKIVECLLKAGANANYIGQETGYTPINDAAFFGRIDVIKLLIEHKAWTGHPTMLKTALQSACTGGQSELASFLLEEIGVNPNERNVKQITALYYALTESNAWCVKELIANGVDIQGYTGSETESELERKQKPLHLAVRKGNRQIVDMLLKYDAKPEETLENGINAVMLAAINDNALLLPLMLTKGNFVSRTDHSGNTLLHHISFNGAVNCADYIVQKIGTMAHVNHEQSIFLKQNNTGQTPFEIALELNSEEVLAIFIPYARTYFFGEDATQRFFNTCIDNRMNKTITNIISFVPADFFHLYPSFLHRLFKKKLFNHFLQIFDKSCVDQEDRLVFQTRFLDSNDKGQYPDDIDHNSLLPSLLHKLINCPVSEVKYHPMVSSLVVQKIRIYRIWYVMSFLYYLIYLSLVSYSIYSATLLCDVNLLDYTIPGSAGRGICELLVIIMTCFFALDEFLEFIIEWRFIQASEHDLIKLRTIANEGEVDQLYKRVKRYLGFNYYLFHINRKCFRLPSVFISYADILNILDVSNYITFTIFVILRLAGSPYQWTFASLFITIVFLGLFKYTRIIPSLGAYLRTISHIFVSDIPQFAIIVLIMMVAYVAGIHVAARQQLNTRGSFVNLPGGESCSNTSITKFQWFDAERTLNYDLKRPILSSIVFLLDGGPGGEEENLFGMNFLFTIIYLFFAFSIIVVMSNILIAQLSQTYSEIVKTSTLHYNLDLVVNLELKTNIAYFVRKFIYLRKLFFITSLTIPKEKWENTKEKCPTGDLEQKIFSIEHSVSDANVTLQKHMKFMKSNQMWIEDKFSVLCTDIDSIYSELHPRKMKVPKPLQIEEKISGIELNLQLQSGKIDDMEKKLERILALLESRS